MAENRHGVAYGGDMTEVIGRGATMELAIADAQRQLDDIELQNFMAGGFVNIFAIGLAVLLGWLIALWNCIFRPVSGAAYLAAVSGLAYFMKLILDGTDIWWIQGPALLVILALIFCGGYFSKIGILWLELGECKIMDGAYKLSNTVGGMLAVLLYGLTAIGSLVFLYALVGNVAGMFRSGPHQSAVAVGVSALFDNWPVAALGVSAAAIGLALWVRSNRHPFASRVGIFGQPKAGVA